MPKNLFVALLLTALFALLPTRLASANGPLHTVQPGETLTAIAGSYGMSAADLAAANGLPQNGWLQPGQQLTIPAPALAPFGAPPPAAAYSGFGSPMPYAPNQYSEPAPSRFAAPAQAMPAPNWTTIEPQQAATNFAPNAWWSQPAQYPPTPQNAPTYVTQNTPSTYPVQPALNQPPTAYQPWPVEQTYQSYPAQTPAYNPPANTASAWPPANSYGAAPPPRMNPALFTSNGEKWIDVNLSTQTLTAFEGQTAIYRALVSTGLWDTPTVVGTYNIYVKYEKADMSGGSGASAYHLEDVPYVMYFHGGYGLHGTYWHSNFGQPMSHGCVNLHTLDAEWLYNWAPVGTKVVTHY